MFHRSSPEGVTVYANFLKRLVYGIVHSPSKKKESPKPPEAEGEHGHKKTEYYDALDNEYSKAMGGEERDREKYWE